MKSFKISPHTYSHEATLIFACRFTPLVVYRANFVRAAMTHLKIYFSSDIFSNSSCLFHLVSWNMTAFCILHRLTCERRKAHVCHIWSFTRSNWHSWWTLGNLHSSCTLLVNFANDNNKCRSSSWWSKNKHGLNELAIVGFRLRRNIVNCSIKRRAQKYCTIAVDLRSTRGEKQRIQSKRHHY